MTYHERMANIQAPDALLDAHRRILSGQNEQGVDLPPDKQNTAGRQYLVVLYAKRMARGEQLPEAMLNWVKEFERHNE